MIQFKPSHTQKKKNKENTINHYTTQKCQNTQKKGYKEQSHKNDKIPTKSFSKNYGTPTT